MYNIMREREKNGLNLVLGGDHSIAAASVADSLDKYESELAVIWVDAHADINSQFTSRSGNFHGMPVASLMNIDRSNILKNKTTGFLKPEQIYYIGLRDLDEPEEQFLKLFQIPKYTVDDLGKIKEMIKGKTLHVSVDVDGIDPLFTPSTGTAVDGGLTMKDMMKIVSMCSDNFIHTIDIVEVNPEIGSKEDSAKTAYHAGCIANKLLDTQLANSGDTVIDDLLPYAPYAQYFDDD